MILNRLKDSMRQMQERHRIEEEALVWSALEGAEWYVGRAAKMLGINESSLRAIIERHEMLKDEIHWRRKGPGRPRKLKGD